MKTYAALLLLLPSILAAAPAGAQKPSVNELTWLAGCWSGGRAGREVTEQWMKPSGGTMFGMSRTVAGGKTVAYEFMQIRQDEAGGIAFVAKPSGQPEAAFGLVKAAPGELVFENPSHDFPQRIIYRLERDGSLAARIEGTVSGRSKAIDFPMKRERCDNDTPRAER